MVPHTAAELAQRLEQLQLVGAKDLRFAMDGLPRSASGEDLLQSLERQQLLTSFQTTRIRKGETEGLVLGGCRLLYRNASGSFARVYRAERIDTKEMIGVKVLRERWSSDADTIQLFHREGEIGQRLKHPNIVPIYEVGASGRIHYIVMEFVEGGNLRDFIKIRERLDAPETCRYGLEMSRALQYAVSQGVTHRDLKTTNVLLAAQGVAKLIDFGLAADDSFLNRAGSPDLAQALEYSTLEKNTGAPRNDPRSDLFFLGTILYELLAGEPPYPRTRDREERKQFSRYRDIRPVTSVNSQIPRRVAAVVDQLLQVNPAHRYQTAGEVAADLESILKELGHPVPGAASSAPAASSSSSKTLLCVEHRPKRQDLLREYFSKHGYRVLLLADADRALRRLKNDSPQAVVLFSDATGDRVVTDFQEALAVTRGQPVIVAAVLSESQEHLATQFDQSDKRGIVLKPPVRLRDLRESLESLIR